MTERDDMDMMAAEYALGTLDGAERSQLAARRQREPDLDTAISAWESRLAPLIAQAGEATPRADLLALIKAEIREKSGRGAARSASNVIELEKRVARWRTATLTASAIAAGLAAFMVFGPAVTPPQEQHFVAVFQKDDQAPAFLLSIDLETRELIIRPVAADPQPGKTYQLWIKADEMGPTPKSLGLLEAISSPTRKQLPNIDPAVLKTALFGISVEPEGGSPTGTPTGPAIHGRLIPSAL